MKESIVKGIIFIQNIIKVNKSLSLKVLAILIIIISIFVIFSGLHKDNLGNSTGNNYNLGIAVQEGKRIYYLEYDDNNVIGIFRVKTNGNKTEKVIEGNFSCLNVIDNYIYCIEYDEDEAQSNLIKIKTNGKNKEVLARNIERATITATNKWVYYYKNDNLYRVALNGTERQKITDRNISYYQIDDNWIYYIYTKEGSQYIARMHLDGENSERIAKANDDKRYEALYLKNGKIYYIASNYDDDYDTEYSLYKMNKKGENIEKICKIDNNIQYLNMQEDTIYYTVTEDYNTYILKSIKYNGTDKQKISIQEVIICPNIIEDWIFFLSINEDYETVIKMVSVNRKEEKIL